jgi:uncharacterized damage-inducible protein DinB
MEETTMRTLVRTILIALLTPAAVTLAQENPVTTHTKFVYRGLKAVLLTSAEKMPEENYSFRPTDKVRTFGQILGHVADSQFRICADVRGEKIPAPQFEKTKSAKADLIAGLKDAFAYCDKAYEGLTDAAALEVIQHFGRPTPRLSVLHVNNLHGAGHYGNLVTYMRIKDIVPPTSEPEFMQQILKR